MRGARTRATSVTTRMCKRFACGVAPPWLQQNSGKKARQTENHSITHFGSVIHIYACQRHGNMCLANLRCRCQTAPHEAMNLHGFLTRPSHEFTRQTPIRQGYVRMHLLSKEASSGEYDVL